MEILRSGEGGRGCFSHGDQASLSEGHGCCTWASGRDLVRARRRNGSPKNTFSATRNCPCGPGRAEVGFLIPAPTPLKRFSSDARTLQWIDRRVGVPICFLLTCARRLSDSLGGARRGGAQGSILFLKLAEQGSTVLACEAVRTAASRV